MRQNAAYVSTTQDQANAIQSQNILSRDFGAQRNIIKFSPHEHVFVQGDIPKGVYEVLSGTVILYKIMADGRRQIQDFASKGDFLALGFSEQHDQSAEALTQVETQFIPNSRFEAKLQDDPSFRRDVFGRISAKLQAAREQALLLGRKCAKERTATFLLFLESRFANQATGYVDIPMSRCDMADYLGLTLETVSRMISRLKKAGIIDLPQPDLFKILDRDSLVSCAGDTDEDDFLYAA